VNSQTGAYRLIPTQRTGWRKVRRRHRQPGTTLNAAVSASAGTDRREPDQPDSPLRREPRRRVGGPATGAWYADGGGIAGIASTVERTGIKIYNEKDKYNGWNSSTT